MRRLALSFVLAILMCGCKPADEDHMKAIIGAILIDGQGGPPLSNSLVVTASEHIREAGPQSTVVLPEQADKIDGSGRFVVPTPIDIYPSADAARQQANATHLLKPEKAALEAAREGARSIVGHATTQDEVRAFVDGGATALVGMITDTEELDADLVKRLRDLRIIIAPALVSQGASLEIASRNTKRLFTAGVPIGMASNGGDAAREPELLMKAGIPSLDVIVAITRNSAAALGELKETGTVQAEKRADLLLLSANPGDDIHNLRKVALRLSAGNWVK
jgi:imidazolonepropionase-like amidohydrolase